MNRRLEAKWKALPPERELPIRLDVLAGQQEGLGESYARRNAAAPDTTEFRVAENAMSHFTGAISYTEARIDELRRLIAETPDEVREREADRARKAEDDKRARMRRRLRQNSQTMVERFMVVTPAFNDRFLERLGVSEQDLEGVDVDAELRVEGIRLVSLDNPERYAEGGESVDPQKLLALHPSDVTPAMKVLHNALVKAPPLIPTMERAERATIVWLPRQKNGFQHPDRHRTVYPPGIKRLALDHRRKNAPDGWAILRGWGTDLDGDIDPINGCEVEFDAVPDRDRFEAGLDPAEVEEILL